MMIQIIFSLHQGSTNRRLYNRSIRLKGGYKWIRENFENNLEELKSKITEMGELSIVALEKSFKALKTQDVEIALKVIEGDTH